MRRTINSGRHSYRLRPNFAIHFMENDGVVYGYLTVVGVVNGKKIKKSTSFTRKNWHKKYQLACESHAEIIGWPHPPSTWKKQRPSMNAVLKRCHAKEIPDPDKPKQLKFIMVGL